MPLNPHPAGGKRRLNETKERSLRRSGVTYFCAVISAGQRKGGAFASRPKGA